MHNYIKEHNSDQKGAFSSFSIQKPKGQNLAFEHKKAILAHLSRRLLGSLLDGKAPLSVAHHRPSTLSGDFFSETTYPIVTKLHFWPGIRGTKSCSNGLNHMTKHGHHVHT